MDTVRFRNLLQERRNELERLRAAEHEAARPVEIDQTAVGHLSRLEAMQNQAIAHEAELRHQAELTRIDAALARIDAGDYGVCQSCEEPIPAKRLELDPAASLCVRCAGHTA